MANSTSKLPNCQVPVGRRHHAHRRDRYLKKVSTARFQQGVGLEAPVVLVRGSSEVEDLSRVFGNAAGKHRAVEPDAVAAQCRRQGVERLDYPAAGAITENALRTDEPR